MADEKVQEETDVNVKFRLKISNLELRSCNDNLLDGPEHTTAEIVQWSEDGKNCWTIASWRQCREGYYDLHFSGIRPFGAAVNTEIFMMLAKYGQDFLGRHYQKDTGEETDKS